MKLSDKKVLVVDNGLFVELAIRLARDFGKVYYCCPGWVGAFPKMNQAEIGYGFKEIEVVEHINGKHYDEIDVFVFPDVYFGADQLKLEEEGRLVWGSRMGEELELCRDATKVLMKRLGLPVGGWAKIRGTAALRDYLKEHKNQWVKVNKWRGILESFFSKDYRSVEPKLDEIEYSLGAFKTIIDFIVEEDLKDKVEIGLDAYTIDGDYPTKLLAGIEIKDTAYVGMFMDYSELPKAITDFSNAMKKTLKAYGYKGFISSENRVGRDHVSYMIDACARAASPPNELYQEFYKNLPDIIWSGANGVCVDPIPEAKYGAELLIHSSWADKNWQPLDFPEDIRRYVKLRNATKINGRYYVIPQDVGLPEIGSVIGWGSTLQKAMDMATEVASELTGYYIMTHRDSFDQAHEEIEKLEKFGIRMFG